MPPHELNAEQSIGWPGGLPAGLPIGALPALMDRLHFRVVAAYGLGMRVRRRGRSVACELPGGVPALVFEWERDQVGAAAAARWWRLSGALVRGGRGGRFGLGVEFVARDGATPSPWPSPRGRGKTRAWVRVEQFPGVFLAPGVPRAVGVAYEAFHAHVSWAYLRLLRAQLAR